jgi:cytochrome c5
VRICSAIALVFWIGAVVSACAARQPTAAPAAASRTADAEALPDGAGLRILRTHCAWCHDLGEVTKFKGYYSRAQWRDIVVTMVEYGARVEKDDVEVLSDYLVQHLGRKDAGGS